LYHWSFLITPPVEAHPDDGAISGRFQIIILPNHGTNAPDTHAPNDPPKQTTAAIKLGNMGLLQIESFMSGGFVPFFSM
jgi:hypothetical protein